MSDYAALAAAAARAVYGQGGFLAIKPLEGRDNPNVLDFEEQRAKRRRKNDD